MSSAPLHFIAHPGAGRGAFARRWPPVEALLRARRLDHEVHVTTSAGEAADLAFRCRDHGARLVVAVGGDGTLHEVVNGLLADLGPDAPRTDPLPIVGLLPAGRGSDYARGHRLPRDPAALVDLFARAVEGDETASRPVDAGEVTFCPSPLVAGRPRPPSPLPDGSHLRRFINGAGIGFSPFVAQRTARFPARLGAHLYTAAGLLTILDWRDRSVAIRWDDPSPAQRSQTEQMRIESLEFALGPYEGGGMRVAPGADPSDGRFDAVLFLATSRAELLTFSWRIRSGAHLRSPRVEIRRTTGATVEVVDGRGPVYLQADGELLGRDPFRFRIVPSALRFVC